MSEQRSNLQIATHLDAKALGYCNAGLRCWFPRDGVSFEDFRQKGVTTDWLRTTGDAMAIRLAEYAELQAKSETNEGAKT